MMDQDTITWTVARTPGVKRLCVACTVVHQRAAYPGSELGYCVKGSEMHEGRRQTV